MYPFNEAVSLTVDEEQEPNQPEKPNGYRMTPKNSKTITNGILEMSHTGDEWVDDLGKKTSEHVLPECTWRGVTCVSRCLRHILIFFRCLALFPGIRNRRRGKRTVKRFLWYILMMNFSIAAVLFNTYLLNNNIWLITAYRDRFGLMHAGTVSCIITGIKPLINAFIISLFAIRIKEHLRLLKTLDSVDVCFRSAFHMSPPIRKYKWVFFCFTAIAFMIPFTFRLVEFIVTEQQLGAGIIQDTAFLIVPTLTVWNIVPLMYYDLYNRIVRFYCRTLIKSMDKEHRKRHFSLKFYYEQFLRITNVQEAIGSLFNPFVLFSLAWSLLVLCLTIYFLTQQPHATLLEPISPEQITNPRIRYLLTRNVHFTMCWAGLQFFVALLHISIICSTGMTTNETTRSIVNAVLRIVPDANADLDRFQISCFVHKMSTQFMWGMTVWRAFPLERTTFFTLVSVIVTYSFLLLKLRENNIDVASPIVKQYFYTNVSSTTST